MSTTTGLRLDFTGNFQGVANLKESIENIVHTTDNSICYCSHHSMPRSWRNKSQDTLPTAQAF